MKKKKPPSDGVPLIFRMSFVHYRSGKRVVSKGRPFPIKPKK